MAAGLLFIFYRENTEEKYMSEQNNMKIIARIHNDFPTKFGSAISAFRISAIVHTRFREMTGAITATAMYRTLYGIRPFFPAKYSTQRSP